MMKPARHSIFNVFHRSRVLVDSFSTKKKKNNTIYLGSQFVEAIVV